MAADRWLVSEVQELRGGLFEARDELDKLREVLDRLSAPPWHPGVFVGRIDTDAATVAMVSVNGALRAVSLAGAMEHEDLQVGDPVMLTRDLAAVVTRSDPRLTAVGDSAEFRQSLPDGRLVVRRHDTEVVVRAAGSLDTTSLRSGDRVRWDPALLVAFERLPRQRQSGLFLEDTPAERFADIGGLDAQIRTVTDAIRLHWHHPDVVARYGMRRIGSVLLVGPSGTGKTMVARALAHWLASESRSGRARFMNVKPGALSSMWYGQSEENYREAFRIAREAGDEDPDVPVVMFFDEIDGAGGARGQSPVRHIDDKVLTSLLTELDGLVARGNVLIVAATNRRDTLDPALLRPGRLGDLVLDIPRPNRDAAGAVLDRHFPEGAPYGRAAGDPDGGRRTLIDAAVSRLYAPNAGGPVASITFRDGTRRAVEARELVSGATLAKIARVALERAAMRGIDGGPDAVQVSDVLDAIGDELAAAVATLTPVNCHLFVAGLPQDLLVTRVDPVAVRIRRPHRFLPAA
jgi:proteasome-associated ATPase